MRHILLGVLVVSAVAGIDSARNPHSREVFKTSDQCMACHNGLRTPSGEDVSIGASWRASMMANSSRDPYWQAGVRREVIDHPLAATGDSGRMRDVPYADVADRSAHGRRRGRGLRSPEIGRGKSVRPPRTGWRGVLPVPSNHRPEPRARPASFTGGYVVTPPGDFHAPRPVFGPFRIERGHDDDHALGYGISADRSTRT